MHTYTPTHLRTYLPTHLHTYTPTHLHTYAHTHILTYTPLSFKAARPGDTEEASLEASVRGWRRPGRVLVKNCHDKYESNIINIVNEQV